MTKRGETVKFKNYTRKMKLLFIIYADFEIILVTENNGKQNTDEFYTNIYQNHVGSSFGINYYVLMINLAGLSGHIYFKMFLIKLSLIWLKKVNIVLK